MMYKDNNGNNECDNNAQIERWIPLESNCDIFNQYFHGIGLSSCYSFEELISFDYREIQGDLNKGLQSLIVMFHKIQSNSSIYNEQQYASESNLQFYMIQNDLLTNACGLVAGLQGIGNIIINDSNREEVLMKDSLLDHFYNKKKTSEEYAMFLANNTKWKEYHKSVSMQGKSSIPENYKDVVHHFVTFIYNENDGKIYELDGRLKKPYCHGNIVNKTKETFLDDVIGIIKQRLDLKQIKEDLSFMLLIKNENHETIK